eukprot:SAG31_NODE_9705_length_1239_cov_9.896491_2_plen_170_part_00
MTVRKFGSHIVGLIPLGFLQTTPFGPTLFRPIPVGGCVGGPSFWPGIGPLDVPSQRSHPTAQPLENLPSDAKLERVRSIDWPVTTKSENVYTHTHQKQLCPFCPDTFPCRSGTGHQPVWLSTFGGWVGTGPDQGLRSLSTALRGGGKTTAPCASASGARPASASSSATS